MELLPPQSALRVVRCCPLARAGKPYTAHLASVADPRYFRFEISPKGPEHLSKTSETAKYRNCVYATNGAFFDMSNGGCDAAEVVNGTVTCSSTRVASSIGLTDDNVSFGMLEASASKYHTLLEGSGWIVHAGAGHVDAAIADKEISKGFAGGDRCSLCTHVWNSRRHSVALAMPPSSSQS